MKPNTMTVLTVYGDKFIVSREHYDRGKTQLPMFTKTGQRLSEYYASMGWYSKPCTLHPAPCTLHRDNIKEILP